MLLVKNYGFIFSIQYFLGDCFKLHDCFYLQMSDCARLYFYTVVGLAVLASLISYVHSDYVQS